MPAVVWHMEEPRVGQSYPNFYAAKLAGSFGKVVLSGAGGDELFAGYPWRYYRAVVNDDFDDYVDNYFGFWQRLVPAGVGGLVLRSARVETVKASMRPAEIFASVFDGAPRPLDSPEDYINLSLYFEAKTFLHGLLVVEDKLSMAHGLETRLPFLDNDLVDFAGRVPVGLKLGNLGEVVRLNENDARSQERSGTSTQTHDGKLILRDVMARYIPEEVTETREAGLLRAGRIVVPRREHRRTCARQLLTRDAALFEFLDRATVCSLVDEHLDGESRTAAC